MQNSGFGLGILPGLSLCFKFWGINALGNQCFGNQGFGSDAAIIVLHL